MKNTEILDKVMNNLFENGVSYEIVLRVVKDLSYDLIKFEQNIKEECQAAVR